MPSIVIWLAVLNLPALFNGGFVDPALERDQNVPDRRGSRRPLRSMPAPRSIASCSYPVQSSGHSVGATPSIHHCPA